MGLDMYLERYPRFEGITAREVVNIQDYLQWKESDHKYTFKQWSGVEYGSLNKKAIKFYEPLLTTHYCDWDSEHKYPHRGITEEVAYWRKANHIHKWFVDNVQNGIDDCGVYEVSGLDLVKLSNDCRFVLDESKLVPCKIRNGYTLDSYGRREYNYIDGMTIENSSVAEQLLPTTEGFFFGGTDYDEYYLQDVKYTYDTINRILKETNFGKKAFYYHASW